MCTGSNHSHLSMQVPGVLALRTQRLSLDPSLPTSGTDGGVVGNARPLVACCSNCDVLPARPQEGLVHHRHATLKDLHVYVTH